MTGRRICAEGLDLIKRWEGLRLRAYRCPADVWTIGYGHTATARPGMVIDAAEAERLLRRDLRQFEDAVERLIHVPLTDWQFAALVSWTFNVGAGALARSTLRKRLNAGAYHEAPEQMMRWTRAGGRVLDGLVNRRAAEVGLWSRGSYVAGRDLGEDPDDVDDEEEAA